MRSTSDIERRLDQLTQELAQLRRAQKSQRLPRAEISLVKITGADVPALSISGGVETAGAGSGIPHYIDSAGVLQPHKDASGSSRTVEVRNTTSAVAKVGELYQTARMPDGKRLISDAGGPTYYRFALTSDLSTGTGTADIYQMDGTTLVESGATIKIAFRDINAMLTGDGGLCFKQQGTYYAENGNCAGTGA